MVNITWPQLIVVVPVRHDLSCGSLWMSHEIDVTLYFAKFVDHAWVLRFHCFLFSVAGNGWDNSPVAGDLRNYLAIAPLFLSCTLAWSPPQSLCNEEKCPGEMLWG